MTPVDEWNIFNREKANIKRIEGVIGVGLAGPHVISYVEKVTPELLREIPESLDGIPIKLKEVGKLKLLPNVATLQGQTNYIRPVPGGYSVGHYLGETGTHGSLVKKNSVPVGLSNNHVTGLRWGELYEGVSGDIILSPGLYDYGGPGSEFGYLNSMVEVPLKTSGSVTVDAAIYDIISPEDAVKNVAGVGLPAESMWMEPGMLVAKSGRTTGLTTAYIETVGATVDIEGWGVARFENVAITDRAFSLAGDSGSLVVNNWNNSCGLVFAGSEYATVICEAKEIEKLLGVEFGWVEPQLIDYPPPTQSLSELPWVPIIAGTLMAMLIKD